MRTEKLGSCTAHKLAAMTRDHASKKELVLGHASFSFIQRWAVHNARNAAWEAVLAVLAVCRRTNSSNRHWMKLRSCGKRWSRLRVNWRTGWSGGPWEAFFYNCGCQRMFENLKSLPRYFKTVSIWHATAATCLGGHGRVEAEI